MSAIIRELRRNDIPAIQPMLEEWVTDMNTGEVLTDEIADDLIALVGSVEGNVPMRCLVAEEQGQVLGIMGIKPPTQAMLEYTTTEHPAELVFALVSAQARHRHIGSSLVSALTDRAVARGCTELVVASGERYKKLGWPFWEKLFGESVGVAEGYGGSGGDAKVWCKVLDQNS